MGASDREEYERHLAVFHVQLDQSTCDRVWLKGSTLSPKELSEDLERWHPAWDRPSMRGTEPAS